jgi:hypothetical protein
MLTSRREMLSSLGAGFGTLALADLLRAHELPEAKKGEDRASEKGKTLHFPPRATRVIFLFMAGGPSHLDTFDEKPLLKKFAGQRPPAADLRTERVTGGLLPAPWEFRPGGQSGLRVSDLLPRLTRLRGRTVRGEIDGGRKSQPCAGGQSSVFGEN